MNILIKLMSIVALVIAPTLAAMFGTGNGHHAQVSEKQETEKVISVQTQEVPEAVSFK